MWTEGLVKIVGDRSESGGKYVVANVDIPQDTLILREKPLVEGPKQSSNLLCVQCCCVLPQLELCTRCGLTLCSSCDQNLGLHKQECDLFVHNNKRFSISSNQDATKTYSLLTLLRLLLSGRANEFESHEKAREGTPIWMYVEGTVVPVLGKLLPLSGGESPMFSSEQIHQAAGVLDTNTFELKSLDNDGDVSRLGRALYRDASLLNNSCIPSCRKLFNGNEICLYTSKLVKAGEELNICYTGLSHPSHIRQAVFRQTKHFTCGCDRCKDPTEMGTYLGSVKCTECGNFVCPGDDECGGGLCNCKPSMSQEEMYQLLERCEILVRRLTPNSDCVIWVSLGRKLGNMLPTHNYIFNQFKEKYLEHNSVCESGMCDSDGAVDRFREELKTLSQILNKKPLDIKNTENGDSSKILYGKDIVKQMMASKLSKYVESDTVANLSQ